jgi:cytochrome c553
MKDAEQARSDRVVHASNWLPAKKVLISPQWERKGTMSLLGNDKTATRPIRMKKVVMLAVAILAATVATARADNAKVNWQMYCAMCHGKKGQGNTPAGRMLGAPNYRDPKVQAALTDEKAFRAIKDGLQKDGRMKMKSFGGELTDQDIRDLAQYLRSFKKGK